MSLFQEVEKDEISSHSGEEAAPSLRIVDQSVQLASNSTVAHSHQLHARPAPAQRPSFLSTLQPRLGYFFCLLFLV